MVDRDAHGDPTSPTPRVSRHPGWLRTVCAGRPPLQIGGFLLLVIFAVWLGVSLTRDPLPRAVFGQRSYQEGRVTNIYLQPFMGLDFHHNYRAVKEWLGGANPYLELKEDPANRRYVYPPLTLAAFTWTGPFASRGEFKLPRADGTPVVFGVSVPAILIWFAASVMIIGLAAWQSWRARLELGLPRVPLPLIFGATLLSYPVLFELERGNCNVLPLLALAFAVACLQSESRHRHWVIGLCAAVAIGIKPYAIVLLPGLLVLREFRAAAWSLGWLILQGIVLRDEMRSWLGVAAHHNTTESPVYMDYSHSLISHWRLAWTRFGATDVAGWPAQVVVACFLGAMCAAVAWPILRRHSATRAAWPFLLWLLAVGTMLLPIAYDYNLLFVPLLLASAWYARDPWWAHALALLALVWLQPFHFVVTGLPLLTFKAASVLSLGALVVLRVRALPQEAVPAPAADSRDQEQHGKRLEPG